MCQETVFVRKIAQPLRNIKYPYIIGHAKTDGRLAILVVRQKLTEYSFVCFL